MPIRTTEVGFIQQQPAFLEERFREQVVLEEPIIGTGKHHKHHHKHHHPVATTGMATTGLASTTVVEGAHLHSGPLSNLEGGHMVGSTVTTMPATGLVGTGGQFIEETVPKRTMGSKIRGAFHDIKTALIGDRHAENLR